MVELFGGIGAFRKALINLGVEHEVVHYVENDKNCVKSYNKLYNEDFKPMSVTDFSMRDEKNIDILMHGSPCQDVSRIGLKKGANKDTGTRSSLLFETIRIIEEMKDKPKVVIWENVKGVLDKKMRTPFFSYLDEMKRLGYSSSFEILNAMDFGIPQKRERVFVVSVLGDSAFDFTKLKREHAPHIREFLEKDVDEKYTVRQPSILRKMIGEDKYKNFQARVQYIDEFCYTVSTKQVRIPNAGFVYLGNGKYRYLTERECFRLMGFSDEDFDKLREIYPEKQGKTSSILYKQAGNSIVVLSLIHI